MRKLAPCPNCGKRRQIIVAVASVKYFTPLNGDAWFTELGDVEILCNTCYHPIALEESEYNELAQVAFNAAV